MSIKRPRSTKPPHKTNSKGQRLRMCGWCERTKPLKGFKLIDKKWCCPDCFFVIQRIAAEDLSNQILGGLK